MNEFKEILGDLVGMVLVGAILLIFISLIGGVVLGVIILYETHHYILFGIATFLLVSFIIGGIISGAHA